MTQYSQYQTSIRVKILAEHTAIIVFIAQYSLYRTLENAGSILVWYQYTLSSPVLPVSNLENRVCMALYQTPEILSCVSRYRYGPIRAVPNLKNTEILLYCPVLAVKPLKVLAVYRGMYQYTLTVVGPQYSQVLTSIEP